MAVGSHKPSDLLKLCLHALKIKVRDLLDLFKVEIPLLLISEIMSVSLSCQIPFCLIRVFRFRLRVPLLDVVLILEVTTLKAI